jgi:hypothetical protein
LLQPVCCHHNTLLCFSFDSSLNFELLQNFNIFHDFSIVLWRWLLLLHRSKGPVHRDSAFLVTGNTFQDQMLKTLRPMTGLAPGPNLKQ